MNEPAKMWWKLLNRTERGVLLTALPALFALQFCLNPGILRNIVNIAAQALVLYLWQDASVARISRINRTLLRIYLAGFALVSLWIVLNTIRVFTYELRVTGSTSWQASVADYAIRLQPFVFWSGIALAVIFIVVLLIVVIKIVVNRHDHPRSPETRNV
jgi:hypothetical protein